jgi:hypothetical protein
MNIASLMERCKSLGATFTPLDNGFKIQAPEPLPDEIVANLKEAKADVIIELKRLSQDQAECWLLEEWRRISLPEWRGILQQRIESKNVKREEYARWMLKEILEDPEYKEST